MTETVDRPDVADAPAPVPAVMTAPPPFLGQATAVEQSRAIAEVQAMIVIAQNCPRDIQAAVAAMRETCAQKALADRAFFKFPRGGSTITGPSIHLARELARIWGNITYGISELRRDDVAGESEILAYAWDCQSNTRNAQVFIVPHKRDTKGGPVKLAELRDVYENNANQGARRVREAIFAVLPMWLVEDAKALCSRTIQTDGGSGRPLATRIADAIAAFEGVGVTRAQLETKVGRPLGKWTAFDVAALSVTFQSVQRGEVTLDEEFEVARVSAAEIIGRGKPPADAPSVATEQTLDEILADAELLASDHSTTIKALSADWSKAYGKRPISDATPGEAAAWLAETRERLAEQT